MPPKIDKIVSSTDQVSPIKGEEAVGEEVIEFPDPFSDRTIRIIRIGQFRTDRGQQT